MTAFGICEATLHRELAVARRGEKLSHDRIAEAKPARKTPARTEGTADGREHTDADAAGTAASDAAQLAPIDRLAAAQVAVEALSDDEAAVFGEWFAERQRERED